MNKISFQSTFLPAQTTLLGSIQRAKQRIFSKTKQQANQKINQNDQNNSLYANLQKSSDQNKYSRKINMVNNNQAQSRYVERKQRIISGPRRQQKHIVANAIKVLQDKILILQMKNKILQQKVQQKNKYQNPQTQNKFNQKKQKENNSIDKQSDDKYWVLKQQCQSLIKANSSLIEELSRQKDQGKKLNFFNIQNQNIDQSHIEQSKHQQQQLKLKNLEQKFKILQKQKLNFQNSYQNEKKKNFTILKLHQQQIIKNQQLILKIQQQSQIIEQLKNKNVKQRKSIATNNRSSLSPQISAVNVNMIKKKNQQLINQNKEIYSELDKYKRLSLKYQNQIHQFQRKYVETKEAFIQLYKDLNKYHPETITANIKYLFQKIKKNSKIYENQTLLRSRSNHFMRLSHSKKYGLSALRSKSGKKGLKMQDLNSSKKSHSKERTNSKNSNRSNKSVYRSPYEQNYLNSKNRIKSGISPSNQRIRQKNQKGNHQKLSQIQKIIIEIKQVSKQIKNIKSEHRNLSVKIDTQKNTMNNMKLQQRMDELIQSYNEYNKKLQQLKIQKDRLALQTVPDLGL